MTGRAFQIVAVVFGLAVILAVIVDVAFSDSQLGAPAPQIAAEHVAPAPPQVAETPIDLASKPLGEPMPSVSDAKRYDDGVKAPPGAHLHPPIPRDNCQPQPLYQPCRPFMQRGPVRRILVRVWRFVFCW